MESLNYTQRPSPVANAINESFKTISSGSDPSKNWAFTGDKSAESGYKMGGVNEYALMAHIFTTAGKDRTHYHIIDIGSGYSHWAQGMATFINTHAPNKQIHVTIISLTGEKKRRSTRDDRSPGNLSLHDTMIGQCTLMTFYAFKIESLISEFDTCDILSSLENNVDLIISRRTFMHFVDPYGVLDQTRRLIRPQTGYFLFDGLSGHFPKNPSDKYTKTMMFQLLLDMRLRFVNLGNRDIATINIFLIQRTDPELHPILFRYMGSVQTVCRCFQDVFRAELERTGPITVTDETIKGDLDLLNLLNQQLGIISTPI